MDSVTKGLIVIAVGSVIMSVSLLVALWLEERIHERQLEEASKDMQQGAAVMFTTGYRSAVKDFENMIVYIKLALGKADNEDSLVKSAKEMLTKWEEKHMQEE